MALVAGALAQAITGCTLIIPGVGLIAVVDWPLIAGIALILVIVVGAMVLGARRSRQ